VISRLLQRDTAPAVIVAMLQHEVVARLRAAPGSKDYGPLSVLVALRGGVEVLRRVPRDVFYPRPDVASSVFRLSPPGAGAALARAATDLASRAFAQRRKRLGRALRGTVSEDALRAAGIDPDARAEHVAPQAWAELARLPPEGGDAT
jgi:16S rRNA (adenine1518-N6/adenine1519-N6)-dimethyltransferase